MKSKKVRLALLSVSFLSLIATSCGSAAPAVSEDSASSSALPNTSEEEPDEPVITYTQIELLTPSEGESINITPEPVANYLNATTEEEQIKTIAEAKKTENKNITNNSVTLSWKKDGSANYTISLATKEDFSDARQIKVSSLSNTYEAENLIPNTTYYWKVKGTRTHDTSSVSSFKTTGSSVRLINASGAYNIRDLGGWKAGENQIAYGKLYRGGLLNNFNGYADLDESGVKVFKEELGVKTEIDLRNTGRDDGNQKKCYFDESKTYIQGQLGQYNRILDPESFADSVYDPKYYAEKYAKEYTGGNAANNPFTRYNVSVDDKSYGAYARIDETAASNQDGISVKTLRTIFSTLADESNYPVYFHCNAGADRTGTLAFLIEGLLGVSYEDTIRDFELTSFSKFGERLRSKIADDGKSFDDSGVYTDDSNNYIAFGKLYSDLLAYYGDNSGNLSTAIYNYLTSYVGVNASEIASVKKILLGEEENNVTLSSRQEFMLDEATMKLDLSEAGLDEGSISSIALSGTDLGTDASAISLAKIKEADLAGEREIVIKAKKGGKDITVYAPVLLITKVIKTVDEFVEIDTYRHKTDGKTEDRIVNYGYYRLANDIGTESGPVKHGGWVKEQMSSNGSIGFRGTIDGNGKTIYIAQQYGGVFSCIGGGAVIKNATFAITKNGSSSGRNEAVSTLSVALSGATLDNVTFNVLSDGWGDNYASGGMFGSSTGMICSSIARGCLIKDVTINSEYPIVSLFGGVYYSGMSGMEFDNLVINCERLGYLGIKSSISGKTESTIDIDDCYLPMDFEGISGSYSTSSANSITSKLISGFASISLGSKYGSMKLLNASFQGKKIADAAIESDTLMFDASSIIGDTESVEGTLSMKLQKDGILCTYSLKVKLTK